MNITPRDMVSSDLTREYINGLVAMGMNKAEIAARAGISRETVYNSFRRPMVTAETERKVLAVPAPPPLDLEWTERGACRTELGEEVAQKYGCSVVDLYYGYSYTDADGTQREHLPAVSATRHICAVCTVKEDCLKHAIEHPELWGIWGGLTQRQITELRVRRSK